MLRRLSDALSRPRPYPPDGPIAGPIVIGGHRVTPPCRHQAAPATWAPSGPPSTIRRVLDADRRRRRPLAEMT
jgi:hypothetical protein